MLLEVLEVLLEVLQLLLELLSLNTAWFLSNFQKTLKCLVLALPKSYSISEVHRGILHTYETWVNLACSWPGGLRGENLRFSGNCLQTI